MSFFYGVGMVVWKHKQDMIDAKRKRSKEEAETEIEGGSAGRPYEVDQKE